MQKRIFKSFSFQTAREGEGFNCDPDADSSECCPENCVDLITIIEHIDEAECFELLLEEPTVFNNRKKKINLA